MELTQEHLDRQLKLLATKQDLEGLATKKDLDGLATKGQITLLQRDLTDIKEDLARISTRDLEDSNAFAKDITDLKKQMKTLAQKVRKLELKCN
jgi:hypothetical protein